MHQKRHEVRGPIYRYYGGEVRKDKRIWANFHYNPLIIAEGPVGDNVDRFRLTDDVDCSHFPFLRPAGALGLLRTHSGRIRSLFGLNLLIAINSFCPA